MRNILFIAFLALTLSTTFSFVANAGCTQNGDIFTCTNAAPNPDLAGVQQGGNANNLTVNVLEGAEIDTVIGNGLNCISTGDGNDNINLNGATLDCDDNAINPGEGINTVNITDSTIMSKQAVLDAVVTGTITMNIQGSSLLCSNPGCNGLSNSGIVFNITIVESIIDVGGLAIQASNQDDIIRLGTGADLRGGISCGASATDSDTLIFAMDVPQNQLAILSAQIAALDPAGDSITINGLFYEWTTCDGIILNELVGVASSVPTLSQWGLIAMAGILGIVGFMVIRRRKVAD